MVKIELISYKKYPDKHAWIERFSLDPDILPKKFKPLFDQIIEREKKAGTKYVSNQLIETFLNWYVKQYFIRRGYNLSDNINLSELYDVVIKRDGSLVDSQKRVVVPINSHSSVSSNSSYFKYSGRKKRWSSKQNDFSIDGLKYRTVDDIFDAAIKKANSQIKPFRIKHDKRVKSLAFRKWLCEYTNGARDYIKHFSQIRKKYTLRALRNFRKTITYNEQVMIATMFPYVIESEAIYKKFLPFKIQKTYQSICHKIINTTELSTGYHYRAFSQFAAWYKRYSDKSWIDYLSIHFFAPPVPYDQSQQVVRSFPICIGQYDKHAQIIKKHYQSNTYYGMLNVVSKYKTYFVFRDLSYPARVFPFLDDQEIQFTEEDYYWNIEEVFIHRLWDPYELSNWQYNQRLLDLREKNRLHVLNKIQHHLDTDEQFLYKSSNQLPNFVPNLCSPLKEKFDAYMSKLQQC